MTSTPLAQAPFLAALNGIRAIAIFWVVLFHLRWLTEVMLPGVFAALEPLLFRGYLGVDLFFTLSGFIIAYVYGERLARFDWEMIKRFWWVRWARLYPLHVASALAVAAIFFLISVVGVDQGGFAERVPFWPMVRQALLIHAWGFDKYFWLNTPSWSISVEWLLYLLFPFAAPLLMRLRSNALALVGIVASIALLVAIRGALGTEIYYMSVQWGVARGGCEFLAGILVYRLWVNGFARAFNWDAVALAILAVIPLGCWLPNPLFSAGGIEFDTDPLVLLLWPVLILALAYARGPAARLIASRPMVFGGELTYAVYLTHTIVIFGFEKGFFFVWERLYPGSPTPELWFRIALMLALIVVIWITGWLANACFAEPARRWLRNRGPGA